MNEHSSYELSQAVHHERDAAIAAYVLYTQAAAYRDKARSDQPTTRARRFGWLPVRIHVHITR